MAGLPPYRGHNTPTRRSSTTCSLSLHRKMIWMIRSYPLRRKVKPPVQGYTVQALIWSSSLGHEIPTVVTCYHIISYFENHILHLQNTKEGKNLLSPALQQHDLGQLPLLSPYPSKFNRNKWKKLRVTDTRKIKTSNDRYLDSRLQTLEHWSILKHVWNHHKPGSITC